MIETSLIFDLQDAYLNFIRLKSFLKMAIFRLRYKKIKRGMVKIQRSYRGYLKGKAAYYKMISLYTLQQATQKKV